MFRRCARRSYKYRVVFGDKNAREPPAWSTANEPCLFAHDWSYLGVNIDLIIAICFRRRPNRFSSFFLNMIKVPFSREKTAFRKVGERSNINNDDPWGLTTSVQWGKSPSPPGAEFRLGHRYRVMTIEPAAVDDGAAGAHGEVARRPGLAARTNNRRNHAHAERAGLRFGRVGER